MLSIFRDLPDWSVGALLAAAGWFALCYAALAPRVLEQEMETKVTPSCVATLRAQEAGAIDAKIARMKEAAEGDLRREKARLQSKDRRLADLEAEALAAQMALDMVKGSPLGQLFPIPAIPGIDPAKIARQRSAVREELAGLKLPGFHIPPVPDAEVLKICACAAADAIGGQQTAIALHLTSFRLWTPDELKSLGSDITKALTGNQCGPKPWENRL